MNSANIISAYIFVRTLASIDKQKDLKMFLDNIQGVSSDYLKEALENILFLHGPSTGYNSAYLHYFLQEFFKNTYSDEFRQRINGILVELLQKHKDSRLVLFTPQDKNSEKLTDARVRFMHLVVKESYLVIPMAAIEKLAKTLESTEQKREFYTFVSNYYREELNRYLAPKKMDIYNLPPMSKWHFMQIRMQTTFGAIGSTELAQACAYQVYELEKTHLPPVAVSTAAAAKSKKDEMGDDWLFIEKMSEAKSASLRGIFSEAPSTSASATSSTSTAMAYPPVGLEFIIHHVIRMSCFASR